MELREFKAANRVGGIFGVEVRDTVDGYTVWVSTALGTAEQVTLTRPDPSVHGLPERSWQDLDRAVAFVRRHGWQGPVSVVLGDGEDF